MCNIGSQIKFKTLLIRSSFCDCSDVYKVVKETITVPNVRITTAPNNINEKVIFKNCASFTDCISKINKKETFKRH